MTTNATPETLVLPINEISVVYLNAGNDTNGNPRRAYVLSHPTAGFLAAVDEGYDGWRAMAGFAVRFCKAGALHAELDAMASASVLRVRSTPCIECSPSYRKRLLSATVQAKFASRSVVIVFQAGG